MERKEIVLNKPQKRLVVLQPQAATSVWGRGTGKSFIIAYLIHLIVKTMPRASWLIGGQTFKQILTRTLPGTLAGLRFFGYELEKDYFIRKKPPRKSGFAFPHEPPLDYDHYMIFKNGTGFHLTSQDAGGGSSRGLNVDGLLFDEGLLLDKEKLDQEISPTNRGNLRYFSHLPYHHGVFYFSSMPYGAEGAWLLDHGNYYDFDFKHIRRRIIELELEFVRNESDEIRLALWEKIRRLKKLLRFHLSKSGFLYSEADIFDNLENVGIKYLEQQYRDLTDFIFMVEILNKRIESIEEGFYPDLNRRKHGYKNSFNNSYITNLEYGSPELMAQDCRMDADLVKGQPLRLAVDWGSKINCLSVAQNLSSVNEFRFLKNFYVKHPLILDDLAEKYCAYYRFHNERTAYFAYDHTGNTQMANSNITYAEQFAKILKRNGWDVHMVTKGAAPTHQEKYLLWSKLLRELVPGAPRVRFNLNNCNELFVSMEQAPAKDGGKGIEKDKSSERSNIPQEQATHLSDTADIQITSLFTHVLQTMPGFIGTMTA